MRARLLKALRCIVLIAYAGGAVALDALHHHNRVAAPGGQASVTSHVGGEDSPHQSIDLISRCSACTHAGFRLAVLSHDASNRPAAPSDRIPCARKTLRTAGPALLLLPQRGPPAA